MEHHGAAVPWFHVSWFQWNSFPLHSRNQAVMPAGRKFLALTEVTVVVRCLRRSGANGREAGVHGADAAFQSRRDQENRSLFREESQQFRILVGRPGAMERAAHEAFRPACVR